jgi:hypothetical protein
VLRAHASLHLPRGNKPKDVCGGSNVGFSDLKQLESATFKSRVIRSEQYVILARICSDERNLAIYGGFAAVVSQARSFLF